MSTPKIVDLPYYPDSRIYFERMLTLPQPVWLDSGKPASDYGRFDILSACPVAILKDATVDSIENAVKNLAYNTDLTQITKRELPFCGGAIGYFDYEYNHQAYGLNSDYTACSFGIYDWCLIQDHREKKAVAVFLHPDKAGQNAELLSLLQSAALPTEHLADQTNLAFYASPSRADTSLDEYLAAVAKIKNYILAGDTYQINYAHRFRGEFSGNPAGAYLKLRSASPSPYSAYIDLRQGQTLLCLSPEQFITIDAGRAISRPIKGTAARASDKAMDKVLAQNLLLSTKDRAENLMIVDLLRNDFSKACEHHSVTVPSLFDLESYANVHHLVSTIEGNVRPGTSPLQFLINCFPGGSITGAPKRRAMEIIAALEPQARSIYCGSICYLSAHGRFDSNIAIRTILVDHNSYYCWGGGGIVADSEPYEEYQESMQKIQLLLDTLQTTLES